MSELIRLFTSRDIGFALEQTSREGWDNTAETFRVCLAHDPDGCFVAEAGGRPVGMITTMSYAHSAWVGNLIVYPEYRRRGLGERLMRHVLKRLEDRGVRTMRLEADPMGVGIYRGVGFADQFESLRFRRAPAAARESVHPLRADETGVPAVTHLDEGDFDAVAVLDRFAFGDDRTRLLRLLHGFARAAYGLRSGPKLRGFAMILPSGAGVRLGPWVAASPAEAECLLDRILADYDGSCIIAGVPAVSQSAVRLLESRGFDRTPSSLRMIRGAEAAEADPGSLFAIANGAMG